MKIVISDAGKDWRGTETMTWLLTNGFRQRGHDVVVFCRPRSMIADRLIAARLPFEAVLSGQDANPATLAACWNALRRHRAAVVITQKDKDVRVTGLMARFLGIPVIVRHVTDRPLKRRLRYRFFFGWVPTAHVANSEATRQTLIGSAPWLDASAVRIIHNGVDTEACHRAAPADLGLPAGALAVGYVGHFELRKGIHDFASAWQQIAPQVPNAHAIIAGAGAREAEFRSALSGAPRVHWLGLRADAVNVTKALDVFVMPSRFEGFGMVLAEAMAAGVACVAYRASNIPELITDDRDGVLVEPGDVDGLAHAVVGLCHDPARRQRLSENARQRAVREFSAERMVTQYEQLALSLTRTKQ